MLLQNEQKQTEKRWLQENSISESWWDDVVNNISFLYFFKL